MDHMMPGMDGIAATRIIRTEIGTEYAKTVPVIALTANALAGNEEMFLAAGFNAFIAKPIDIMRLDVVLNQWVRDKQTEETLWKAGQEQTVKEPEASSGGVFENAVLDGMDFAAGLTRYGTEKIYVRILQSYLTHTPGLVEKLRSLTRETLPDYAITVHGLKGASYGICAMAVGKEAEELEFAAKAGDYEKVNSKNAAFLSKIETTLENLKNLLQESSAGKEEAKPKSAAPDNALLEKLLDASKRFKPAIMEEVLAELEKCEYESGGELIPWLREQIDNLEYDTVREKLESLDL
jgi:CheY-like chemotaxis protein